MRKFFLIFCLFTFACVQADSFFEEESDASCRSFSWEAGIEYLLLKPCANDLTYAAHFHHNTYTLRSIDPSWSSAWRASLGFPDLVCSTDFLARYMFFDFAETSSHHSKRHWKGNYQLLELLFSYPILMNEYYSVQTLFGVDVMNFDQHFRRHEEMLPSWKSSFIGSGLSAGLQGVYRLSENFEFLVKGTGSLLVGEAKAKQNQEGFLTKDHHFSHLLSGYAIESALCYDTSLFNFDTLLKVGYEFCSWTNLPSLHAKIPGHDNAILNTSTGKTWGYHGLSLGMNMKF